MKFPAFILSVIILSLAVIPCADGFNHEIHQKTEISVAHHSGSQDDCDHCSPLCSCNCCHAGCFASGGSFLLTEFVFIGTFYFIPPDFKSIDLTEILIPPKS